MADITNSQSFRTKAINLSVQFPNTRMVARIESFDRLGPAEVTSHFNKCRKLQLSSVSMHSKTRDFRCS